VRVVTRGLVAIFAVAWTLAGCATTTTTHGVPNLRQVEGTVWRSGQPTTPEAWRYLRSLGITTIVKLNRESEGSDAGAVAAGMTVIPIPMPPSNAWETLTQPAQSDIRRAVAAMRAGHALVHCTHGQDRTGLAVGAYRMWVDRWTKSAARREMDADGFHPELLGLEEAWEALAP